jgi:Zn finger protein HypA/HybF involved in hydrogenase expression
MSSEFQCDFCMEKISVPDRFVGRKIACPMCEKRHMVPEPDPARMFVRQELADSLDRFRLTDWDREYSKRLLELRPDAEDALRGAIASVRNAMRKGGGLSVSEALLKAGAVSADADASLRRAVKTGARPEAEETSQCPNCFAEIPASGDRCRYCGQRLGDLLVVEMCPNCKQEQPRLRKLCRFCGADMKTGLKPGVEYPLCPRCGELVKQGRTCPLCGTSVERTPESIRREQALKGAKEWLGRHSLSLVGLVLVIVGLVVWRNWDELTGAGERRLEAALRSRVERLDRALGSRDLEAVTDLVDPLANHAADARTLAAILGREGPLAGSSALRRAGPPAEAPEGIEHPAFEIDREKGSASVATRATVAGSASRVTWRWVLREGVWYYRGPLPK